MRSFDSLLYQKYEGKPLPYIHQKLRVLPVGMLRMKMLLKPLEPLSVFWTPLLPENWKPLLPDFIKPLLPEFWKFWKPLVEP